VSVIARFVIRAYNDGTLLPMSIPKADIRLFRWYQVKRAIAEESRGGAGVSRKTKGTCDDRGRRHGVFPRR
jgi:hypothetical protein